MIHQHQLKWFLVFGLFFYSSSYAQTYILVKTRPAQLNTSAYRQIAIGDIVSPSGNKSEASLNLSDAIAASLFKANAQEILDRNALEKILFTKSELTAIDEKMLVQLKKKVNSALLITGRIQTSRVTQQQVSQQQGIVVNGCSYMYYWKATCNVTVQIKIIDISTGKMLYTGPIAQESVYKSREECSPSVARLDEVAILQTTTDSAASKVAHLVVPYSEKINLVFASGNLLKHPFKKLDNALSNFEMNNNEAGLAILKNYTEDASLKDNFKAQAHYNYGLGLLITSRYEAAKEEFKDAFAIVADQAYQYWYSKVDEEKALDNKLVNVMK